MERQTATKVQKAPERTNRLSQPGRSTGALQHPLAGLQQSIGSQATQRLIRSPYIQTKLTVSTPGDPYEREADRVADTVMRMPDPVVQRVPLAVREDDEEEKEKIATKLDEPPIKRQTEEEEDEESPLVARSPTPVPASNPPISPTVSTNVRAMQGSGSELPASTRTFFESRFNTDFSHVRVHTDGRAVETADSLNARAFTVGPNIAFGAGQYSPDSSEGKRLLAHELTHVVQQTGSKVHRAPAEDTTTTEDEEPQIKEGDSETPDLMGDWYNFDIPFTDYYFDPSLEGVETAAGLAKDAVVDAGGYVAEQTVSAFDWVFEKVKGLISDGVDWLTTKYDAIKEFAVSAFDTINIGIDALKGFITAPAELLNKAFELLDSDLLGTAWSMLKAGATAAWKGIEAIINGVLESANGLWDTVSGYVTDLFDRVEGIMDSWPFQQLPDFLQSSARVLFQEIRDLWVKVRDFLTDLLKRLKEYTDEILDSLVTFVQNIVDYGIDTVIATVKKIRESWDFITEVASDPVGFIRPLTDKLAAQINTEGPPKAMDFSREKLNEKFRREKSADGKETVVQLSPADTKSERSTASWDEVLDGLYTAASEAWSSLNIGQMLLEIFLTTFYPPATVVAIGKEFSELVHNDWAVAREGLYAPRTDGFWHFLHDVWSNILALLDFPLALVRRLTNVTMLFLGLLTTVLVVLAFLGGGILGGIEGGVPGAFGGAFKGAQFALELMAPLGQKMLMFYLKVEGVTIVKSLVDLFTARQTEAQKKRDYMQIVASVIGVTVAAIIVALLTLLSSLIGALISAIRGVPKPSAKATAPSEVVKPAEQVKPEAPGKSGEPVEPTKTQTPEEPAKPAEEVKPPPEKPVMEKPGAPNTYVVTDVAALKTTKPSRRQGYQNIAWWHWELYVTLPDGRTAVFCEVNIRFRRSPDLNLDPGASKVKGTNEKVVLKVPEGGFSWTTEALKLVIETYKKQFGREPKNLGGFLAKSNIKNFQYEFARFRVNNPGMSTQQIAQLAVEAISFGSKRSELGYTHFNVEVLKVGEVKLIAGKHTKVEPKIEGTTQTVPTQVRIEGTKTPFEPELVPPISPADVVEGEGESGDE